MVLRKALPARPAVRLSRGARRPALCLTDHVANREQQSEFGVDHLEVAHAELRSVRRWRHFTLRRTTTQGKIGDLMTEGQKLCYMNAK